MKHVGIHHRGNSVLVQWIRSPVCHSNLCGLTADPVGSCCQVIGEVDLRCKESVQDEGLDSMRSQTPRRLAR